MHPAHTPKWCPSMAQLNSKPDTMVDVLRSVSLPPCPDPTADQLRDLIWAADRLGLRDAAEWLRHHTGAR